MTGSPGRRGDLTDAVRRGDPSLDADALLENIAARRAFTALTRARLGPVLG
jgi:hypothetical protein